MKSTRFSPFISLLFLFILPDACHHRSLRPEKTISFYYWKTRFHLGPAEEQALTGNQVKALYTRYFDVDFAPGDTLPHPVAPIVFGDTVRDQPIIPVVFFRNRVFENLDSSGTKILAGKVFSLVSQISRSAGFPGAPGAGSNSGSQAPDSTLPSIQFDCDWTEKTRDRYFLFLRAYRSLCARPVSATIRLHQVKYPERTGIPPVDQGTLMYYNMGDIGPGDQRSIYERKTAARYIPYLKTYPLQLDIALPVFAWGLLIREGKVVQLLDKMNFRVFENDSNFMAITPRRFLVKQACFKQGYYFREKDEIKIESIPEKDLLEMVSDLNRFSNHRLGGLIFYDLDDSNLAQYDKDIFKKILDRFD